MHARAWPGASILLCVRSLVCKCPSNSGQYKAPFNQIKNEARVFTYKDTANRHARQRHTREGLQPGERRPAMLVLHGFGRPKKGKRRLTCCMALFAELGHVALRFGPRSIGVMGHGFGAAAAIQAGGTDERVAAMISWRPSIDVEISFWTRTCLRYLAAVLT